MRGDKYIEKCCKDNNINLPEVEGNMALDIMDGMTIKRVRTMVRHYMNCDFKSCVKCRCNERLPDSHATVCTLLSLFKEEIINKLTDNL